MLTKKCILFNTDEKTQHLLHDCHYQINIFGQRQHGICSQGRCQLSRTQYFRKAKHLTSKENILVTSNQGTAIPTASSFGEKKKQPIERFPIFRHIQFDPVHEQTPGFQFVCVNFSKIHKRIVDFQERRSLFNNTNWFSILPFFFTQDYASRIIFYLSATSHVHKLISLQDPYFLSILRAKEAEYCPIHCLKNYINQRRKQDGHLSNCLSCILVAMIQLS